MHGLFLGLPIYSFKHTFRLFSLIFLQLSFTSITGIYLKSNTIMLIILLSTKKYVLSNIFVSFFSNKHHYYRAFVKDLIPYTNMNSYFLLMYSKLLLFLLNDNHCTILYATVLRVHIEQLSR